MQLVVITPDKDVAGEQEFVQGLFDAGLRRLHLRKPSYTAERYRDYLRVISSAYHDRIVLHGCFELFGEYNLGGLHLNSAMRCDEYVIRQISRIPPEKISASFHTWQEIKENEFPYGYVFISPVFDSISKRGYNACIDLAGAVGLKIYFAAQSKYCPKIYGLGGVAAEQIGVLHQHGFDGAALLGSVWQTEHPVKAFERVLAITRSLKDH